MQFIPLLTLLTLPALNAAQDYGGSSSSDDDSTYSTSATSAGGGSSSTPTSSSSAAAGVHTVAVGQGGLTFTPNSFTAAVGDQVEFHFDSPTHSVAQGDFNNACQPLGSGVGFWSGFPKDGSPPFTITVNSTDPIWFYCAQVGHCQAGMVGVINPSAGQSVQEYASAAGKSQGSKAPAQIQGGIFGAVSTTSAGSGSGSSSSSSASSPAVASPSAAGEGPKMQVWSSWLAMAMAVGCLSVSFVYV